MQAHLFRNLVKAYSLIELMIVIVILSIIAAVAYPTYTQYIIRGNRVYALNALLDVQSRMENYFLLNSNYNIAQATDLGLNILNSVPNNMTFFVPNYGLNAISSSPATPAQDYYQIIIAPSTDGLTYIATAIPVVTEAQGQDANCVAFEISSKALSFNNCPSPGLRCAQDKSGNDNTKNCWGLN